MQSHEKFYTSLTAEEKEIFNLYKSNDPHLNGYFFSDYLNTMLGREKPMTEDWNSSVSRLDGMIKKHTLETEMWLYRATDDQFIAPFIKNGHLTYSAFMSTATTVDKLQRHFANADTTPALLRIRCAQGSFAAPMEGNPDYGAPEYEYLLGRNGVFKLIDRKEITEMSKIVEIMGLLYAREFSKLIDYTFEFLFYKEN